VPSLFAARMQLRYVYTAILTYNARRASHYWSIQNKLNHKGLPIVWDWTTIWQKTKLSFISEPTLVSYPMLLKRQWYSGRSILWSFVGPYWAVASPFPTTGVHQPFQL
jgi:hypothetical protein